MCVNKIYIVFIQICIFYKMTGNWYIELRGKHETNYSSLVCIKSDVMVTEMLSFEISEKLWLDLDYLCQRILTGKIYYFTTFRVTYNNNSNIFRCTNFSLYIFEARLFWRTISSINYIIISSIFRLSRARHFPPKARVFS